MSAARCDTGYVIQHYKDTAEEHKPEWIFCSGCIADTSATIGIHVESARGFYYNDSWVGYSAEFGMLIESADYVSIDGSRIYNNGNSAIAVANAKSFSLTDSSVLDSGFDDNCASAVYLADTVQSAVLVGNTIRNDAWVTDDPAPNPIKCYVEARGGAIDDYVVQANLTGPDFDRFYVCEPEGAQEIVCPYD